MPWRSLCYPRAIQPLPLLTATGGRNTAGPGQSWLCVCSVSLQLKHQQELSSARSKPLTVVLGSSSFNPQKLFSIAFESRCAGKHCPSLLLVRILCASFVTLLLLVAIPECHSLA